MHWTPARVPFRVFAGVTTKMQFLHKFDPPRLSDRGCTSLLKLIFKIIY
jgi:hypothetical protein